MITKTSKDQHGRIWNWRYRLGHSYSDSNDDIDGDDGDHEVGDNGGEDDDEVTTTSMVKKWWQQRGNDDDNDVVVVVDYDENSMINMI